MNPKRFLMLAGAAQITLGTLGLAGWLGRISTASFFHPPYWINGVHLSFGTLLVVISLSRAERLQNALALMGAIFGLTLGIGGALLGPWAASRFQIPELADYSDHIAHLMVGSLALWGWLNRPTATSEQPRAAGGV